MVYLLQICFPTGSSENTYCMVSASQPILGKGLMKTEEQKSKKQLQEQYREREIIGGVYIIRNRLNNKALLKTTADLQGSKNRFYFSQKTGSCVDMKLQNDWNRHGGGQFAFEVLEELKKSDKQTAKEFKTDIDILKEMWIEKLTDTEMY